MFLTHVINAYTDWLVGALFQTSFFNFLLLCGSINNPMANETHKTEKIPLEVRPNFWVEV